MTREKITYIFNSGFIYESEREVLIFDYYIGPQDNLDFVHDYLKSVSSEKNITVLVSHGHHDHYSREIFRLREIRKDIDYIISSDVTDAYNFQDENNGESDSEIQNSTTIKFLEKNQKGIFLKSGSEVRTFASTDIGVSYLVLTEDKSIFHAGDLNWWDWGNEDSEKESMDMEIDFKNIVRDIKESLKLGRTSSSQNPTTLDFAFFPVDPRMEERAYKGAMYFIEEISPKKLIPMHFGDDFEICGDLKELCSEKTIGIAQVKEDGKVTF